MGFVPLADELEVKTKAKSRIRIGVNQHKCSETDDPETKLFHNGEGAIRKQLIKAWKKAGVKVTLQMLRVWFCNRMGELGVQDRYIDIFCGRASKSVLAKHYTSREIKKLKAIYDRANLKVLA